MNYFKQLLKNLLDFARAMTPSQAIMLIGVTAGLIVGIFVVTSWLGHVTYSTLYSNLDSSEAGEIINYLNENNVPYELSNGGGTISVPSGDVYKTRISLASQGIPRSGNVGYAIFDQSNLGMTEFLQNLNFRRALEGELMRTIMQLSEVKAARVHIVMPKDRLFKEDKKEATASVVLKLKSPGSITKAQVSGIAHLVASSVEGLKPENITILDYNGNMLSSNVKSDKLAGLSSSQHEVRMNVEKYLENKAQSMLDGLVGAGRSIVKVTADLDFQQVEKTSELYDPNSTVVRSEEKTEETKTASEKQDETAQSDDHNSTETSVTNYEINKTVEHIINSIGNIQRLSVAVLLDGTYRPEENAEGATELTYQPRSQEDIDRISAIVKSAVGFDTQRSDQIEVVNLPFDKTSMDFEQEKLDSIYEYQMYYDIGKKVGLVLLAIVAFLYLRKKVKRLFAALGRILPQSSSRAAQPRPVTMSNQASENAEEEESIAEVEYKKRVPKLVDRMQETARHRPEEIAKVIKTMMVE